VFVSLYDVAPDGMAKIPAIYPAHRERLNEFHRRGVLVAAGPLGKPPVAALGIFTTREAAEEFVAGDPFVMSGAVASWRIVEWDAVFLDAPPATLVNETVA